MSNKASTPANASPLTVKEAEQPDIVKKIGNTTYRVKIHFSTTRDDFKVSSSTWSCNHIRRNK